MTFCGAAARCFLVVSFILLSSSGIAGNKPNGWRVRMPTEYEPLSAVLMRWQPTEGISLQTDRIGQGADEEYTVLDYNTMALSVIKAITDTGITARIFIPDDIAIQSVADACLAGVQNEFCEPHNLNINLRKVEFLRADSDSIWTRDYGPFSVVRGMPRRLTYVDPSYYSGRADDDVVSLWAGFFKGMPPVDRLGLGTLEHGGFLMQGGNLLLDKRGNRGFITDHAIIQNQIDASSKNIAITPQEIEENIRKSFLNKLGIDEVVIFPSGKDFQTNKTTQCANDDALGCTFHIDMGLKILPLNRVLIGQFNENDPNCEISINNEIRNTCAAGNLILNQWAEFFDEDGYSVFRITNPPNAYDLYGGGSSVVRSYTNSLILNNQRKKSVVVPIYDSGESLIPNATGRTYNQAALDTYREALGRRYNIVGVNADVLAPASGSIHCITMQIPKRKSAKGKTSEFAYTGRQNTFMVLGSWLERGRKSIFTTGDLDTQGAYPSIIAEQLGLSVGLDDTNDFVIGDVANFYSKRIYSNLSTELGFVKSLDEQRQGSSLVRSELLFPEEAIRSKLDAIFEASPEIILLQLGSAEVAANFPAVIGPREVPLSAEEFDTEATDLVVQLESFLPESQIILATTINMFGVVETLATLGQLGQLPPGWSIEEFVDNLFNQLSVCSEAENCTGVSRQALSDYNSILSDISERNGLALADFSGFFASATGLGPGITVGGIHFSIPESFGLLLEEDPVAQGLPGILTPLGKAVLAYLTIEALNSTYDENIPLPDLCTFEPVPTGCNPSPAPIMKQ